MTDALVEAAERYPELKAALEQYLTDRGGDVYTEPRAFQQFIDGGGNIALYENVGAALRGVHARRRPSRVVDIGCGDGRLTTAALRLTLEHLDLVEPSGSLLDSALARVQASAPGELTVASRQLTAQQLVDGDLAGGEAGWDLAQSTFAMHAIEPSARRQILAYLASATQSVVLVEFDVPAFNDRSAEHAVYAAERYAAGIAEYEGDDLVVQGFLMPVLVGQFHPAQLRHTWEQPVETWISDLRDAGFRSVRSRRIHDYWWATAHIIEAETVL